MSSETADRKITATSNELVKAESRLKEVEERPGKAKISDIKAVVEIKVSGVIEDGKWGSLPDEPLGVLLNFQLGRSSSSIQKSSWPVYVLIANKFYKFQGQSNATYYIEFRMSPLDQLANGGEITMDQLNELDMVILRMANLPSKTEIVEGSATVTFNASIIRKYLIPAQKTQTHASIILGSIDGKFK